MAKKRRTKKQKIKAKRIIHPLAKSVEKTSSSQAPVKGQFIFKKKEAFSLKSSSKNARVTAKDAKSSTVRRDIVRSLIIASLILSLEVVIYLIWSK